MSTRSTARGAGANAAPAPAKAPAVVPWETLVANIRNVKGGNNLDLYKAISELMKHAEAKVGKAPRFFAALRDEFTRRAKEADSPWIPTSAAYQSNFNQFINAHVLGADPALKAAYTALAERRVKLTLAGDNAGLAKFTTDYNEWLAKQFTRRIQEAGGPAAAAGAPAPSPDSASSSPVMVPETIAADSDSESGSASGSASGSVSGSNSDEEEEEEEEEEDEVVPVDASSVAGASSVGSAAPDAALVADLARLQLELAASQGEVRDRDARIRDANAARDRAVSALANAGRLNSNYAAMQTDLRTAKATNTDLQAQIDRLEGEVQAAVREKADLQARFDALVKSTDKERAAMLAQINAFAAGNPGDNSALVQTLRQQNADLTAQHEADQAQVQIATNKLTSMQTKDKESIRRLEAELARLRIAPDDLDVSPAPTESHSPMNVPKQQQRLEPRALYVLLAGLVSA